MNKLRPSRRPDSGGALVWLLVVLALGGVALVLVLRGLKTTSQSAPEPEPPPFAFENTAVDVAFVGSEACRSCHAKEFEGHAMGTHAHSFSTFRSLEDAAPASVLNARSGLVYQVALQEAGLQIREVLPGEEEDETIQTHDASLVLGAPGHARLALAEIEGYFVPAPIEHTPTTDGSDAGGWVIARTSDRADAPSFDTELGSTCIACHTGGVSPPEPPGGSRFRIRELGIGCESCHGAGALHVQRWSNAATSTHDGPDRTIANAKHMTRRQALDVCNRCHLSTQYSVPIAGTDIADWRPGLLLRDFHVRFEEPDQPIDHTQQGHMDRLRRSACFQKSGAMTCSTCHKPHEAPAAAAASYRETCLSCHGGSGEAAGCTVKEAERRTSVPDDSCAACHMPESELQERHRPRHEHRIGVYAGPRTVKPAVDTKPRVVPVDDLSAFPALEQERLQGLADLFYAWLPGRPVPQRLALLDQAAGRLEAVLQAGAADARVHASLAWIYEERKQPLRALASAEAALATVPPPPAELQVLVLRLAVRIRMRGQEWEAALRHLDQIVSLRRRADDWGQIAVCCRELTLRGGDHRERLLEAVERMLAISPQHPGTQWEAAEHLRFLGLTERAEFHAQLGQRLESAKDRNR